MTQNENQGLMAKLLTSLKVLTGRQLTQEDIKLVMDGYKSADGSIECRADQPGEFTVIERSGHYGPSPDFSYGWKIPHYGLSVDSMITCVYDWQGRLKEKQVWTKDALLFAQDKKIEYNPPGRFFGKRVE